MATRELRPLGGAHARDGAGYARKWAESQGSGLGVPPGGGAVALVLQGGLQGTERVEFVEGVR
ncbi:hypothetical protein ACWCP6_09740 [Streptomyces sp. NPDC002004]